MARTRRLEVYADTQGGYRWRLTAPNGNVIGDSGESYPTNALALKAARSLYDLTKPVTLSYNIIRRGEVIRTEEEKLILNTDAV
jgi:uncharacterized protein YegP (UPF0339 family)